MAKTGRPSKPKVLEDRPGRPQRTITMQEEIMEELHIVAKDFEEGFYGKGNDLDIDALTEDLEHVINYARDLKDGAPLYPATGDEYMLKKWEDDMRNHEEHMQLHLNAKLWDGGFKCLSKS